MRVAKDPRQDDEIDQVLDRVIRRIEGERQVRAYRGYGNPEHGLDAD